MLIFLFIMTFFAGIMFGYMMFRYDPSDFTYVLKTEHREIKCEFNRIVENSWDFNDGLGKRTIKYVELVEK